MKGSKPTNTNGRVSDLQSRVTKAEAEGQLNNTRRGLLHAILDNAEETYFLSSRELAKLYDIDAATVVRTVQALGYERFADFASALRQHFVTRITPYRAMKIATQEGRTPADHVIRSLDKDLENMNHLRERLDVDQLLRAARHIRRARRVLVVGLDFVASLAVYLDYGLTVVGIHSEAPVGTSGNLLHKLRILNAKDVLVAISFGRCLRETVNAAIQAKAQGVLTLGITDSELSPVARFCDMHLLTTVANPSLTASYAAAMSLVNALIVACAHITPKRSLDVLRQGEQSYFEDDRWYENDARRVANSRQAGNARAGNRHK
jgi:DNA-binding MurR/RpiR family transcriptional regulator